MKTRVRTPEEGLTSRGATRRHRVTTPTRAREKAPYGPDKSREYGVMQLRGAALDTSQPPVERGENHLKYFNPLSCAQANDMTAPRFRIWSSGFRVWSSGFRV